MTASAIIVVGAVTLICVTVVFKLQTFAKINTRPRAAAETRFCTEMLCAPPPRGEIFTYIAK